MGVDIANAALAAGHALVATGRNSEKASSVLGAHDDPIVVALDITDPGHSPLGVVGHGPLGVVGHGPLGVVGDGGLWMSVNGRQRGNPAKLDDALVHLGALDEPPPRFPAGADAVATLAKGPNCSSNWPTQTASCLATSIMTTSDASMFVKRPVE